MGIDSSAWGDWSHQHAAIAATGAGQWHPHEMRHSAGSYMAHMGVPHEQIAEILGHAGTRTTEEVYIHNQEIIDMNSGVFTACGNQATLAVSQAGPASGA